MGGDFLHKAASNNNGGSDAIKVLLANGADPNTKKEYSGETPLMTAAEYANWWACEVLLANGAEINVTDIRGKNAYTYAMEYGNSETAKKLFEHGARPIMVS